MSRATDSQSAHQTASGAAASGPDLDAEHDPAVARSASRASLDRHAAKTDGELTAATTEQRAAQRDQSNHSSIAGLEAAVGVASKQLVVHAEHIDTLASLPATAAGQEPLRQAVEAGVAAVTEAVTQLSGNIEIAAGAHVPVAQLRHALALFDRAYNYFTTTAAKASAAIHRHGGEGVAPAGGVGQKIEAMYAAVGLVTSGSHAQALVKTGEITALRELPEDKVIASALDAMLIAASDSVRLARMNVAGVAADTRERDFERACGHVRELAALLARVDLKTVHAHKQKLLAVAHGMNSLFDEEAARPDPKQAFRQVLERASVARGSTAEIAKAAR